MSGTTSRPVLLVLGLLLIAPSWWTDTGNTGQARTEVNPAGTSELFYEAGNAAGAHQSGMFEIVNGTAKVCFDPDIGSEGVAGAEAQLRCCIGPFGDPNSTFVNWCPKVLTDVDGGGVDDVTLNGDDGSTTSQRTCIYDVPPGRCYLDITVAPDPNETFRAQVLANDK